MEAGKDREIPLGQQIEFLRKVPFFEGFDDLELKQLLAVGRWLRVPAGTQVIREDSLDRVFYILVKGEVAVVKQAEGDEIELSRLRTGDCFGEMSLVTDVRRTAGVKTTAESYLLMIEAEILNSSNLFLQVKFYRRFCEILVSRLIQANRRMIGQEQEEDGEIRVAPERLDLRPDPGGSDQPRRLGAAIKDDVAAIDPSGLPPMPQAEDRVSRLRTQKQILSSRALLPVYPGAARQMRDFLAREGASNTRKFVDLIGLDPVMALRVLQVANSSFFRRAAAVTSLPHAMVSLGIEQIGEVVRDAMEPDARRCFSGFAQVFHRFWLHSLAVARIAELLERIIRANAGVNIYLAGLLHDIGVFALDQVSPRLYAQTLRPGCSISRHLRQAEHDFTGVGHDLAGGWLAERLGLPEPFARVILYHHHPRQAREYRLATALVHLANLFANQRGVCLGEPPPEAVNPLQTKAWLTIQEEHRPFADVNVREFVASFDKELDRNWEAIVGTELEHD